jgi:hypothetical protein
MTPTTEDKVLWYANYSTLAITLRGLVQVPAIAEIGEEPAHMVRRSSDWAREQIADPAL